MSELLLEARNLRPENTRADHWQGLQLTLTAGRLMHVLGSNVDDIADWLRCLAAMSEQCAGSLYVLGDDVSQLERNDWQQMRTRIAFLGRRTRLLSVQTLMNNIILPALYHKRDKRDALVGRAEQMLQAMGLQDMSVVDQLPAYVDNFAYSCALIARVLLLDPKIIIVDDFLRPFNKKDATDLLRYIEKQVEQTGMAALVHHHDMGVFMPSCNGVLFVGNRAVQVFDSRDALLASEDAEVRTFVRDNAG